MPRLLLTGLALLASLLAGPAPADAHPQRAGIAGLESALRDYLVTRDGHVRVAVQDLVDGRRVVHRAGPRQWTASIVKVEILMALLSEHHAPLQPDRAARARRMIEQSSNTDAEALWNVVGGADGITAFDHRIGLTHTDTAATTEPGYSWGHTLTTPGDQLRVLGLMVHANAILTDTDRHYVHHLMTHVETDQQWGVTSGPSSQAVVAVKDGWLELGYRDWQVNSIGRVRAPHHDYVIGVMTRGSPSMAYGIHTIEHVSRIVWRHLRVVPAR